MYTHQTKKGALCFPCLSLPYRVTNAEGAAYKNREEKWPLMRMEDGRILRIAKSNLVRVELKKEIKS